MFNTWCTNFVSYQVLLSIGIRIKNNGVPHWLPHPNFQWLQHRRSIWYLGCRVGIDITNDQLIAPLLMSLKKKLLFWSSKHLSFAGRIIIANQVLLSSMWYILSSWLFLRSVISHVQRLIRNFLWGASDVNPRSKVAWKVIISPPHECGLGLIDPMFQCKTLLEKFVVRSMMPASKEWDMEIVASWTYEGIGSLGGHWSQM